MRFTAFAPAQAGLLSPQISHHLFLIKCTHQNNQPSTKHAPRVCPARAFFIRKKCRTLPPLSSLNTSPHPPSMAQAILAPKGHSTKKEITCSQPCTPFFTTLYFILKPTIHQTRLRVCPERAFPHKRSRPPCNPLSFLNTSYHPSTKRRNTGACPEGHLLTKK